jgi:hypothetical protein
MVTLPPFLVSLCVGCALSAYRRGFVMTLPGNFVPHGTFRGHNSHALHLTVVLQLVASMGTGVDVTAENFTTVGIRT